MKTCDFLKSSSLRLRRAGVDSAQLDAELILAHVLSKSREWLLAHVDEEITPEILKQVQDDIGRRLSGEPLVYITGKKEFYGREFIITPDVLIPRPETEQIIELLAPQTHPAKHEKVSVAKPIDPDRAVRVTRGGAAPKNVLFVEQKFLGADRAAGPEHPEDEMGFAKPHILDIGTGSGVIAVTLALELPSAHVFASDISEPALKIAKQNAETLSAEVEFIKSDLLQNICNKNFDIIVANLPYVDKNWSWLDKSALAHEPEIALFTEDNGLELIKRLIRQAPAHLNTNGVLVLELDPCQMSVVKKYAEKHGFDVVNEQPFCLVLQRRNCETAKHK